MVVISPKLLGESFLAQLWTNRRSHQSRSSGHLHCQWTQVTIHRSHGVGAFLARRNASFRNVSGFGWCVGQSSKRSSRIFVVSWVFSLNHNITIPKYCMNPKNSLNNCCFFLNWRWAFLAKSQLDCVEGWKSWFLGNALNKKISG